MEPGVNEKFLEVILPYYTSDNKSKHQLHVLDITTGPKQIKNLTMTSRVSVPRGDSVSSYLQVPNYKDNDFKVPFPT